MRHLIPYFLLLILPLPVAAQLRIGYLSYQNIMQRMPEYAQAQEDLSRLKEQYDQEAARGEEEFQAKFTEFLQGQKDFPQNILLKRQAELQTLMENGISFRQEAERLLSEAEAQLLSDITDKLNATVQDVGASLGYALILNIDGNALPFVSPTSGEDVTYPVLQRLGLAGPVASEVNDTEETDFEAAGSGAAETGAVDAEEAESRLSPSSVEASSSVEESPVQELPSEAE